MNRTLLLVLLCVVATLAQEADYPESDAPRPRNSLLRRGALARTQANKATPSTTTTAAPKEAPVEELEEEGEELEEEIEEDAATTTEANRRIKGGVVRPFRSNDDLLAALKRRRVEAANGKTHHTQEATSAPATSESQPPSDHSLPGNKNNQGRRRYNAPSKSEPAAEEAPASAPIPKLSRNRFSARNLFKSNSPADGEVAGQESKQEPLEAKPKGVFKPGQKRF